MSCNCNNTTTQTCQQCSAGQPCNCPPDYSVTPLPVDCNKTCCPPGYTYHNNIDIGFPNGMCCPNGGGLVNCTAQKAIQPIPCTVCIDSIPSDCVFVSNVPCLGVTTTTSLTSVLSYLCSEAFILSQLQTIGLSSTLKAALCEIISICPSVGNTTPIPGPITVTIP